jgi:hypothetical protein
MCVRGRLHIFLLMFETTSVRGAGDDARLHAPDRWDRRDCGRGT